ncbi:acyl-CoA dehydrogenase [Penicillium riverlandense]|uniref:acyl-CoA dehydrogenase n=1 Tax=Penicillium riverlandense TaxID=1903569 RepID=UPI002547F3DE|nr:acyl-CoA dehydrogenase [Penicillium riverlandense]KAJ5807955.1 acyl-CoA dehydrogenase [Penicillium riverlandense]
MDDSPSLQCQPEGKGAYSRDEVALHNLAGNLWVVIDQDVYDLSSFQDEHPGGAKILLGVAGKDASKKFHKYHRITVLNRYKETLQVGILDPSLGASKTKGRSLSSLFRTKKGQSSTSSAGISRETKT